MGGKTEDLKLALFCGSDFAGDNSNSKSNSSAVVCVAGPTTFLPTFTLSKKQGCMSTRTRESGIVAMSGGLREAFNVMDLWDVVFKFAKTKSSRPSGPQIQSDRDASPD